MTLEEIREIRTQKSREIQGMTTEEMAAYFQKGADRIEELIAEKRREREANNKKVALS
jgi:hypothetical protein